MSLAKMYIPKDNTEKNVCMSIKAEPEIDHF